MHIVIFNFMLIQKSGMEKLQQLFQFSTDWLIVIFEKNN